MSIFNELSELVIKGNIAGCKAKVQEAVDQGEDVGGEGSVGEGDIEPLDDVLGDILSEDLIFDAQFIFRACGNLRLRRRLLRGVEGKHPGRRFLGNNVNSLVVSG